MSDDFETELQELLDDGEEVETVGEFDFDLEDFQKIFAAHDRMVSEIPQIFQLFHQGIVNSIGPLTEALDALKIKVDALVAASENQDPNN
jgi:hypothetical protein